MDLFGTIPEESTLAEEDRIIVNLRISDVFSSALYFEDTTGTILLLHDSLYGQIPFGFAVENIRWVLSLLCAKAGDPVFWTAQKLCFSNGIAISLRQVPRPVRQKTEANFEPSALEWALSQLKNSKMGAVSELVTAPPDNTECFESLFAQAARKSVAELAKALLNHDGAAISFALKRIVGLGPGLTPSMDDFLTGAMCTFHYASFCWEHTLPGAELLYDKILHLPTDATGKYSRAYLNAAASGQRFSIVERILSDFSKEATAVLLKVGGHSGADMMTGVLWAIKCIKSHQQ